MKFRHPCKKCIVQFICKNKCDNITNYMKILHDEDETNFSMWFFVVIVMIYLGIFIYFSITSAWWFILIPIIIAIAFTIFDIFQNITNESCRIIFLIGLCIIPALVTMGIYAILEWYYYKYLPKDLN